MGVRSTASVVQEGRGSRRWETMGGDLGMVEVDHYGGKGRRWRELPPKEVAAALTVRHGRAAGGGENTPVSTSVRRTRGREII